MSKHTPEPWAIAGIADEMIVAKVSELAHAHIATIHHNENDSRRIVACVNACAGVDTDLLEAGELDKPIMLVMQENKDLKLRCYELLEALREASKKMNAAHNSMFNQCLSNPVFNAFGNEVNVSAINDLQLEAYRVESVIAKAKGGAA